MTITEKTRELCKAIQADERYTVFVEAKKANDSDEELQNDIGAFNLARMSLDKELASEDKKQDKVEALNEELRKIYGKIMMNPIMVAYNEAKSQLDVLVNEVNGLITMCINGADPDTAEVPASGCGGSCSSCSGCH